jgi:8-oxo-dGTP pyrophosphatase MutT (NUDIX family)
MGGTTTVKAESIRRGLKFRFAAPRAAKVQLAQLQKNRKIDQVAAVCYRVRRGKIEFLLVQTRGSRRWTFPKGGAEAGLTHAQAAAIEAFEEAGVHGRIEEASFVQYFSRQSSRRSGVKYLAVSAHLCEVSRLCTPKEANRNRTWFSVAEAKDRLCEGRERKEGTGFTRIVDKAVGRIRVSLREGAIRSRGGRQFSLDDRAVHDEWNRVQLEAKPKNRGWMQNAHAAPMRRGFATVQRGNLPAKGAEVMHGEVLPFPLQRIGRNQKLLSAAKKL